MNTKKNKINPFSIVKNNGLFYDVNFMQYYPNNIQKKSQPSSFLLASALSHIKPIGENYVERILEIQNQQGYDKTLWGLRNENGVFSLEFYFFYSKKFKENSLENLKKIVNPYLQKKITKEKLKDGYYLISYNFDEENIKKINIYYPLINKKKPIITIDDTGFSFNTINPVFHSFYFTPGSNRLIKTNTYYTFFGIHEIYQIMERTRSACIKLFPKEDPFLSNKYFELPYLFKNGKIIHTSAVTIKKTAIGFYFLDISFDNFILFLKYHKYPVNYINGLEKGKLNHLKFDIGIDFYLENGKFKIKKTAFWGTF